jgi:hypothetical protein
LRQKFCESGESAESAESGENRLPSFAPLFFFVFVNDPQETGANGKARERVRKCL